MRAPVFSLGLLAVLAVGPRAHAEDAKAPAPPLRIGVVPLIGVGAASLTNSGDLPGFIGFTALGVEIHGERPPLGLLVRGQFLASGMDGRWTAPTFALGASYRFFGDGVERLSLIGRAGPLYQRWHATNVGTGCPVRLFFPTNCKALPPIAPTGVILAKTETESVTVDGLGAFAGVRLELPLGSFFAAVDAELSMVGDVSQSSPGAIFSVSSGIAFGFRDRRDGADVSARTRNNPHPLRRGP